MASFALSYAMADLGWKFYLINASYDIVFLVIIYLTWVETKGIPLEEIALKFEGTAAFVDSSVLAITGTPVEETAVMETKQAKSNASPI